MQFTVDLSVSSTIITLVPGSFHLRPPNFVTIVCSTILNLDKSQHECIFMSQMNKLKTIDHYLNWFAKNRQFGF